MKMMRTKFLLIIILLISLCLRLIFFVGPCCDDVAYLNSAHKIIKLDFEEFSNGNCFTYRTMMMVPIAISIKTLGT
jgi:hypothetical protein